MVSFPTALVAMNSFKFGWCRRHYVVILHRGYENTVNRRASKRK
jgi:hypothetical protein